MVTGDTHGDVYGRLQAIDTTKYIPEETALIILGDAGINFYLNTSNIDKKEKQNISSTGYYVYCVRGNHEERPENIATIQTIYDENVDGFVYYEPKYPNIRYFMDGGEYIIDGYKILTIGGAYSPDKWLRLSSKKKNASWTGWFKDEQLTEEEMKEIETKSEKQEYDFILTHTCPFDWIPVHLFSSSFHPALIDKSMEHWLNELKDKIHWKIWLFGHFHSDEVIKERVEVYYKDINSLRHIFMKWENFYKKEEYKA